MLPRREQMGLHRHLMAAQGGHHGQGVLHRHAAVRHRVPQKGRAGGPADVLVQGEILIPRGAGLAAAHMGDGPHMGVLVRGDDRVAQHHGVGPVFPAPVVVGFQKFRVVPQGAQGGRQMPPGGEPAHRDALRVAVPFRPLPQGGHRLRKLPQGPEILGFLPHGIGEEEHVVTPGEKPLGHRVRLPLGDHLVPAAGAHHHGGEPLPPHRHLGDGGVQPPLHLGLCIRAGPETHQFHFAPTPSAVFSILGAGGRFVKTGLAICPGFR